MDHETAVLKYFCIWAVIITICGSIVGYRAVECYNERVLRGMECGYSYQSGWLK